MKSTAPAIEPNPPMIAATKALRSGVKPMFGSDTFSSLFSTHPPLEDRIAALREMSVVPQR